MNLNITTTTTGSHFILILCEMRRLLKPAEKVKTLHIFIVHESVFIYVSTSIHLRTKT